MADAAAGGVHFKGKSHRKPVSDFFNGVELEHASSSEIVTFLTNPKNKMTITALTGHIVKGFVKSVDEQCNTTLLKDTGRHWRDSSFLTPINRLLSRYPDVRNEFIRAGHTEYTHGFDSAFVTMHSYIRSHIIAHPTVEMSHLMTQLDTTVKQLLSKLSKQEFDRLIRESGARSIVELAGIDLHRVNFASYLTPVAAEIGVNPALHAQRFHEDTWFPQLQANYAERVNEIMASDLSHADKRSQLVALAREIVPIHICIPESMTRAPVGGAAAAGRTATATTRVSLTDPSFSSFFTPSSSSTTTTTASSAAATASSSSAAVVPTGTRGNVFTILVNAIAQLDAQEAAERQRLAREDAERVAAEQARQADAERVAAEQARQADAVRVAAEQARQADAVRVAAEQARQADAVRVAAEAAKREAVNELENRLRM